MSWPPKKEPTASLPFLPMPVEQPERPRITNPQQFERDFKTMIGGKFQRISNSPYKRDRN